MKKSVLLLACLSMASWSSASFGADTPPKRGVDQHLLSKLHAGNQNEIALGKLAQERGTSQEVKDFGAMLVKDHSAADQKVLAAAQEAGIKLESPPMAKSAKESHEMEKSKHLAEELKTIPANQFDEKFKEFMVADHKKDVSAVSKAIPKLKNAEVKQTAEALLPTLKHHEKMAEDLAVKPQQG